MILYLMLYACADKATEEGPEAHACEHIAEAGSAIDAAADTASAPAIAIGEEPYTVALVDGAPGYLSILTSTETEALLFVGTADVANNLWFGATELGLPEAAPNDLCPEDIPEHYDLDLTEAGTYTLELGPAAVSEVWLMLTSSAGHAHEE